jgi:DnaJ-class molecular chaperone
VSRFYASEPTGVVMSALYDPHEYPGRPGEVCRACTGSGTRYRRLVGKTVRDDCDVCLGSGVVTARRIGVAA